MTISNCLSDCHNQPDHTSSTHDSQINAGSFRPAYSGRVGLVTIEIDEEGPQDFGYGADVMIETPHSGTPKFSPVSPMQGAKLNKTQVYKSQPRRQYNKFVSTPSMQGAGNSELSFADAAQGMLEGSPRPF
uniref:Uncharacterized protein n=1 Tax=Hanusia phi TaxID=3032 RepID=A0A7S0HQ12_9CRYP|mmetsp:Transcript_3118/g.7520  ORF Transcript_3118/g.7520 Transcript_3118/m.7520 type:complete len:131 (+) Transcript_3118:258-650(+)